jgi:hypothetical protein
MCYFLRFYIIAMPEQSIHKETVGARESADARTFHATGTAALAGYNAELAGTPGYLPEAFVAARETDGTWVTIAEGEDAFVTCSDDRRATKESAAALLEMAPEGMRDPREATTSTFGGLSGAAKAVLVTGVALYGEKFIRMAGGFHGVMDTLILLGDGSFTEHTAEAAENSPAQFNPEADAPIACAYNLLIGLTAVLLSKERGTSGAGPAADSPIQAVGRRDQHVIFGNDDGVDALMDANAIVARHMASLAPNSTAENFSIDRKAYARMQTPAPGRPDKPAVPVVILAGQHKPAAETGVISNFVINQCGRPGEIYRLDIARTTKEIMKALGGYGLRAELLMRALQLDSTPVRAALYSHDPSHGDSHGPLDPHGLPMAWRGDPWAAIRELDARYGDSLDD